jgi:hypothetical protein
MNERRQQAVFWMIVLAGSLGWINAQLALYLFPHPLLLFPYVFGSAFLLGRELGRFVARRLHEIGE